jgi:hypothetical protein
MTAAILMVWLVTRAAAQAPLPVAERISRHGDTSTRVSLFSNQVVVVTISTDGQQGFMRRLTLPSDQYLIYLKILEDAAAELGERPVTSAVDTSRDRVDLTLNVGTREPRVLSFSPMATVTLPLARIMGALNDLEQLARTASPSAEELRTWEPQRGDRLELMTGGFARVVDIYEGGVLILENETTYVRQVVPPEARDEVILHVVERSR